MENFRIYDIDNPKPDTPASRKPCLGDALDGRILFLKQPQGFWICAEDNDPEPIEVHVAIKRRYGTVDDMEELTYDNLGKAFAI